LSLCILFTSHLTSLCCFMMSYLCCILHIWEFVKPWLFELLITFLILVWQLPVQTWWCIQWFHRNWIHMLLFELLITFLILVWQLPVQTWWCIQCFHRNWIHMLPFWGQTWASKGSLRQVAVIGSLFFVLCSTFFIYIWIFCWILNLLCMVLIPLLDFLSSLYHHLLRLKQWIERY
jgi:hypothetical protein